MLLSFCERTVLRSMNGFSLFTLSRSGTALALPLRGGQRQRTDCRETRQQEGLKPF